ncbi:MAG: type II secretion system F family protein, partial [Planctomycetota bacterium]
MRQYKYKTKNSQGKLVSGVLEAQSEGDAVSELRRRGLTVISMSQSKGGSSSGSSGKSSFFSMEIGGGGGKRVKSNDLVIITRQLATMVSAGIPLVEGLEIIEEQSANPTLRKALGDVVSDVRSGKDLSQSLQRHPKIFSDIYINMIRAGEASGQLDTVLERLADYQEDAEKLKSEIKSAMTYPVVSLIMVSGITLFLLVFIIPKFKEMFSSMGVELPWVTSALLATSDFLRDNMMIWMSIATAIGV